MKPVVAIVGRANVGKSTLFNRFIGARQAIVEDIPGITRDRLYQNANWLNRDFTLIDTGGIEFNKAGGIISIQVKEQAALAIEEADVIIFVLDSRAGITADDQEVAALLRKSGKPVVLAVNKVDNFDDLTFIYDYYTLALGEPYPISAIHGMNTGDLLDAVVAQLPEYTGDDNDENRIMLAMVGRPNVGKSSLVNRILGQNRMIVSDIPGTTRDAIDTSLRHADTEYTIIDTAGMRRKGRINEPTERYSVARSLNAIDRSDVVALVLDAQDGMTEQDTKIAAYTHQAGKGLLLVMNKWDLPEKDDKTLHRVEKEIQQALPFAPYARSVFVSALTGQRVDKILPLVYEIAQQHNLRISTARLNEVLREAVDFNPPPPDKGHPVRLYYGVQVGVKPPKIVIFSNRPETIHFSYARYIENKLRESFDFSGTPIHIMWRKREKQEIP